MKNQYFGDINDFRKYGLLRTIERISGLSIGVCWFLTADDGGADGELRKYLSHSRRWRNYDSDLFDKLQRLLGADVRRSVSYAQAWASFRAQCILRISCGTVGRRVSLISKRHDTC